MAALLAGRYPNSTPIPTDTPKLMATVPRVGVAEKVAPPPISAASMPPMREPTPMATRQPRAMPSSPPMAEVVPASMTIVIYKIKLLPAFK